MLRTFGKTRRTRPAGVSLRHAATSLSWVKSLISSAYQHCQGHPDIPDTVKSDLYLALDALGTLQTKLRVRADAEKQPRWTNARRQTGRQTA